MPSKGGGKEVKTCPPQYSAKKRELEIERHRGMQAVKKTKKKSRRERKSGAGRKNAGRWRGMRKKPW